MLDFDNESPESGLRLYILHEIEVIISGSEKTANPLSRPAKSGILKVFGLRQVELTYAVK